MHTQTLTHADIFERWLFACSASPWEPLTPAAAEPYRYIWGAWGRALGDTHWNAASATQVLAFINSAAPTKDKPSDVTRRRYWRVLDRIYEFACLHGLAQNNPTQEMAPGDVPAPEDYQGAILSPRLWAKYQDHLPAATSATGARDAAILMVLADCAATLGEVQRMQLGDVLRNENGICGVRLTRRNGQARELPVSETCAAALGMWLNSRDMLGTSRLSCSLFVGRDQPSLTAQMIHKITDQHLSYVAMYEGLPMPVRRGPQIIRSTVIVQWLQSGLSVLQCLERTGLKTPGSFSSLRHYLPLHVRQAIASSTPSEEL